MNVPTTVCRATSRRRNEEKCGLTTSPDTVASSRPSAAGRLETTARCGLWRKPLQGGGGSAITIPQRSTRWNSLDAAQVRYRRSRLPHAVAAGRSEEHTSELQ